MYPKKSSDYKLIFPVKRVGEAVRVSEQEAKISFINEVVKMGKYYYAVEVPTKKRYSGFSNEPAVHEDSERFGRSASIDLSLFEECYPSKSFVAIEFKSGQPTVSQIKKDLLKLLCEEHDFGIFFHVLEHTNSGTLKSLIGKINSSVMAFKKSSKKISNTKIFFFIVILENQERKNKSRYTSLLFDYNKNEEINVDVFRYKELT